MNASYCEKTIREFLHILAQDTPLPAGGSLAALGCALSASFGVFLARLTLRTEKNSDMRKSLQALPQSLEGLSVKCLALMDSDVIAYEKVLQALRMPHAGDEEKALRKEALNHAWRAAFTTPFEVMQKGLEILRCSSKLIESGYPATLADTAVIAEMAFAGLKGGLWIVMANLKEMDDDDFIARHTPLVENIQSEGEKLYKDIQKELRKCYST